MSNELFMDVISKTKDELKWIDTMTFSGFGEFSLDSNWRFKVKNGRENFEKIHILTNLSLFKIEDLDFLIDYANDIRISIYGFSNQIYNDVHKNPNNITLRDIEKKVIYLAKIKNSDQKIILNYVECEVNKHETKNWIEKWKNIADLVEVWKPHNWGDAKQYRPLSERRLGTCGRLMNGPIQVQVDGTVNVCCFDYNGELLIGDLKRQSFSEVFSSSEMSIIQKIHREGKANAINLCSKCDQRNPTDFNSNFLLYSSRFNNEERVGTTSTEYARMI